MRGSGLRLRPNLSPEASDKVRYFVKKYPDLAQDGSQVCNFLINACADWLDWAYGQISMGRPIANGSTMESETHLPPPPRSPIHPDDFLAELTNLSME